MNTSIPEAIQAALVHHQAGRLPQAEAYYQQILQVDPNQPDALHLLGLIAHQVGKNDIAAELIGKAVGIFPNSPMYYNLGSVLQAQGKLAAAVDSYRAAIALTPEYAEAHSNLGGILQRQGELDAAAHSYLQALALKPGHAELHNNLGNIYKDQGQPAAAIDSYHKAIGLNPGFAAAHYNLANIYKEQDQLDDAIRCYQKALSLKPDYAEAHGNLGAALQAQGKLDAAIDCYRQALALKPDYAQAHNNLGSALRVQGKFDAAVESYRKALVLKPDLIEAHSSLGAVLQTQGKLDDAIESCRRALALKPDLAELHYNLGNALQVRGKHEEAVESYRRALELKPDLIDAHFNIALIFQAQYRHDIAVENYQRALALNPEYAEAYNNLGIAYQTLGMLDAALESYRKACSLRPDFVAAHSNLIFTLDLAASVDTAALQDERRKWDVLHAAPLAATQRAHANSRDAGRRLRIGYVSADFRVHSAVSVFGGMLVHFDRSKFDVYVYSNTLVEDALSEQFKRQVSHWRRIVDQSDEAVADMIRRDEIDILVDLSGHSAGHRLLVFAHKPAPIQITAWGYATSTGMTAMDVFFADPVIVPPEEKALFTEEIRYLPNLVGYFRYEAFPEVGPLPALSADGITFGSFNRLSKVSEQAFQVWAQVMLTIPNSRLILKAVELDGQDTRDRVVGHFVRAGIDPKRIVMLGKTPKEEHWAAFNRVDIALDPFPHGGGVSTLEGLMMGVPVITLRWKTIVGRLSASFLTTLGLTDWIAETPEQYVEIAVQKARDLMALNTLRGSLRELLTTSIIGDTAAYTAAVENEYRQLWREWCERQGNLQGGARD